MDVTRLGPVYDRGGPFATDLLDVSRDTESGVHEQELRVRSARDDLVRMDAKYGSRGKIQDRCCQGLIASAASHRRTVEAEICSTTPRVTTSRANSGQLHRVIATPAVVGNSQAKALTPATTSAVNLRGRPLRNGQAHDIPTAHRHRNFPCPLAHHCKQGTVPDDLGAVAQPRRAWPLDTMAG